MMEFVLVRPLRTYFWHLVDFPASSDVFVHQASDLFQRNVAQLSSGPLMRRFRQFKLDVVRDIPVAERVPVRRKSIRVGQRRHRILRDDRACLLPLAQSTFYAIELMYVN